jgi:DNA-binding NtrC family response regulator
LLTDAAIDQLRRHSWPGNIRELENYLEKALIFTRTATQGPLSLKNCLHHPVPAAIGPALWTPDQGLRTRRCFVAIGVCEGILSDLKKYRRHSPARAGSISVWLLS